MLLLQTYFKRMSVLLFYIVTSLFLFSCSEFFFKEFTVEDACIKDDAFCLTLSSQIEAKSLEESFCVIEDEVQVKGKKETDGNTILFFPADGITDNHKYSVILYAGARDINGNSLQNNYKKIFYTKEDLSSPVVKNIECIVRDDKTIQGVLVDFNKPIDKMSFEKNFSIAPSLSFISRWNTEHTGVRIIFTDSVIEKTDYSICIGEETLDAFKNKIQKKFYWSFIDQRTYVKPDYELYGCHCGEDNPVPLSAEENCVDFSKPITIRFNKMLDADKVQSGIHIEADCMYEVLPCLSRESRLISQADIIIKSSLPWNKSVCIYVSDITDSFGEKVPQGVFLAKNNSEYVEPPSFVAAAFTVSDNHIMLYDSESFPLLAFPTDLYPFYTNNEENNVRDLPMYFFFTVSGCSTTLDKISAIKAISVSATNNCAKINLRQINIFNAEASSEIPATLTENLKSLAAKKNIQNKKIICVKYLADFTNRENDGGAASGLIRIKISKDLKDDRNNHLEEDLQFTCNKI